MFGIQTFLFSDTVLSVIQAKNSIFTHHSCQYVNEIYTFYLYFTFLDFRNLMCLKTEQSIVQISDQFGSQTFTVFLWFLSLLSHRDVQ